MNVIDKRGWRVCLLDIKKTTWNQLLSKQSFFLLKPLSSSMRLLTQRSLSSSLVCPRLRRYCLRNVTHTTLLVHFTNADSAFQIHYSHTLCIKVFLFIIWSMSFRCLLKGIKLVSYIHCKMISNITAGEWGLDIWRRFNCLFLISV